MRTWGLVLLATLIVVFLSDAVNVAFTNTATGTMGGVREIDWRMSEFGPQRHIAAMIEERRRSLQEMKAWLTRRHATHDGHRHLPKEGGPTRPGALALASQRATFPHALAPANATMRLSVLIVDDRRGLP